MKKTILLILLFGATNIFAQQKQDTILVSEIPDIKKNISQIENKIDLLSILLKEQAQKYQNNQRSEVSLKSKVDSLSQIIDNNKIIISDFTERAENQNQRIKTLETKNQGLGDSIKNLNQLAKTNSQKIVINSQELGTKIQKTEKKADSQIAELDNSVHQNQLYCIIATVVTLLLGGLIYWLLVNRITFNKTNVEAQIRNAKASIEEESVKLDNKLVEVLTKQLEVIKADQATNSQTSENDHSLVLKVADRLTAMETNHYRMDPKTKGLKQLVRAVKSIKENYLASGYEIVEMMGQEYKEGLNVTANFIPSEEIETGKRVITRIIKPQVNFKGKMIQAAQIEVSVGE